MEGIFYGIVTRYKYGETTLEVILEEDDTIKEEELNNAIKKKNR